MPKRAGNLYQKTQDREFVKAVLIEACRGRHDRRDVRRVYENLDAKTDTLVRIFKEHSFKPHAVRKTRRYDTSSQKWRDIKTVPFFPDACIQWVIIYILMEPVFMRGMDHYCCSSIPGRGGERIKKRLTEYLLHNYKDSKYAGQMDVFADCVYKAAVAGQTMWMISANAGEANILLSPSSVSPDLVGIGIDANQSYAMYVSALSQMSAYYGAYGEQLKAGEVKISSESLDLYCHGSIYDADGVEIASDVVFTPYVYVSNMAVTSGTNTFSQDGVIMIWDWGTGGLSGWDASDAESHNVVVMPKGASFVADEIVYHGEAAQSVQLTVKEIQRTEGLQDIVRNSIEDPESAGDWSVLAVLIMVELAAIFAIAGYAFRVPVLYILAAVSAAVGLLAGDWVLDLLVGVLV